jgi:hypothetical protein
MAGVLVRLMGMCTASIQSTQGQGDCDIVGLGESLSDGTDGVADPRARSKVMAMVMILATGNHPPNATDDSWVVSAAIAQWGHDAGTSLTGSISIRTRHDDGALRDAGWRSLERG